MVKGQKILVSISEEGTREVYISYRKVLWAFLLHEGFVFEITKGNKKEILYDALLWCHIPSKGSGIINKSIMP